MYSDAQADAYEVLVEHYHNFFSDPAGGTGLRPSAISDPEDTRQLTAYFSWSAWVAAAERPGKDYSYTNNRPPEELVDNGPTADVVVWSVLSLIALLVGIGALLAVFGRWNWLGWHGRDHQELSFRTSDRVALTPSQKATAGFFLAMAVMFLVQTLVGVASQHYRAENGGFFGIDSDRYLPFNVVRTWHVQLSIFWARTNSPLTTRPASSTKGSTSHPCAMARAMSAAAYKRCIAQHGREATRRGPLVAPLRYRRTNLGEGTLVAGGRHVRGCSTRHPDTLPTGR